MLFHRIPTGKTNNEPSDLSRFIKAQDSSHNGFADALKEIKAGKKRGHWMWYIFPQLRGLGFSRMSHYYGISGQSEAEAFLNHPILGSRLREITEALLDHRDRTANEILGTIDAIKLKSCMTLFDSISPDDIFAKALDSFFNGNRDPKSIP